MTFNVERLSESFRAGLAALAEDYGFTVAADGVFVECALSDALRVEKTANTLRIQYAKPCEFYRGFVIALSKPNGYKLEQRAAFERLGFMADNSRNAVFNMDTAKRLVRMLACCGYDYLKLYTEDTYELEGEPYFGYLRGRYTLEECRELDAYAAVFGVELIPCIQTLAHLNGLTRYGAFTSYIDCDDILLIDDERTYALIDKMFAFAAAAFRSRRINIGMDEAHRIGLGKYLDKHGYHNRFELMRKHLQRVLDIADAYGFTCSMWSDMFFRLSFGGQYYADQPTVADEIVKSVPENVHLVYWDYYHRDKSEYNKMLAAHKRFDNVIEFAGGAWKWTGFSPNNLFSLSALEAGLTSCAENGIDDIMLTSWGDNGAECPVFAVLPAIVFASEKCYGNEKYAETFYDITGYGWEDFLLLDYPNGRSEDTVRHALSNSAKIFLYNDCLQGFFDPLAVEDLSGFYSRTVKALSAVAKRKGRFGYLFETAARLTEAVAEKYDLGLRLRKTYKAGDKKTLLELATTNMSSVMRKIEAFYLALRRQWMSENKPFGWEVQDIRLGGLLRRVQSCQTIVKEYCTGQTDCIAELEAEILPLDGTPGPDYFFNLWSKTVTTSPYL